jgi:hypothetical protein
MGTVSVCIWRMIGKIRHCAIEIINGVNAATSGRLRCNFAEHLFYRPPLQPFYSLNGAVLEQIGNLVRVRLIQLLARGFDRSDLFLGQWSISPSSRIKCAQIIPLVPPVPVFTAGKELDQIAILKD